MTTPNLTGGQVGVHASIDALSISRGGTLSSSGTVGQRLLQSGFDLEVLRPVASGMHNGVAAHATLSKDEWFHFDNTIMGVARERLTAVSDVISRGLVWNLPNAMGVMNIEWERVRGELEDAEVTMSGLTEAVKDRQELELLTMPIPIFHKEFFYNLRHLQAARNNGRQIDVSHAEVATRKIAELIEHTYFHGLQIAGQTIYGIANHPDRQTILKTADWSNPATTGEQIVIDVIRMIEQITSPPNNFEGPFLLYVSRKVANRFGMDYKAFSDKTIMQRIMEVPGVSGIMMTSRLADDNVLAVQMTSDVVQMIDGIQPTMVEWESHAGFQHNFKIFAIMLPRVRSTGWRQSGIIHLA